MVEQLTPDEQNVLNTEIIKCLGDMMLNPQKPHTVLHAAALYTKDFRGNEDPHTFGELCGYAGLDPSAQKETIQILEKVGLLAVDGTGPFALYKLNEASPEESENADTEEHEASPDWKTRRMPGLTDEEREAADEARARRRKSMTMIPAEETIDFEREPDRPRIVLPIFGIRPRQDD